MDSICCRHGADADARSTIAGRRVYGLVLIWRQVLEYGMPLAERKQMDIGVTGTDEVVAAAGEMNVGTLGTGETGSGLGLSIVKGIAGWFQAQVHLPETDELAHTGLRLQVVVPIGA